VFQSNLKRLLPMTLPPPGAPGWLPVEPAVLFAYGPLAFPEVMQVLLGRVPDIEATPLAGWRVAVLPGHEYPTLVIAEAIAHGGLIKDLSATEWHVLDAFADEASELRPLSISDGRAVWAYTCAGRQGAAAPNWDAAQFEKNCLVDYLKNCAEWRRAYDAQLRQL